MLSLIWKGKLVKPLESYDPESIGEYKLIGRLGSGGFGTVYVATKNNGLKFALKVLHQSLSQDLKVLERLSREAEAIGKVEGKRTVTVHEVVTSGEHIYLAMELVPGETLDEHIEMQGPLQAAELWSVAQGLAEGLRDIHNAGIIHRDLKPSNIIYGADGVKIVDFGISVILDHSSITRSGEFLGSIGWRAPEQIRSSTSEEIAGSSDVFNLGLVIAVNLGCHFQRNVIVFLFCYLQ